MSRPRSPDEQALDRLVCEIRELPDPELDWAGLETRLMNAPRPESRRPVRSVLERGRLGLPAAALVAVAAGAFLFALRPTPVPMPAAQKPVAKLASGPLNGDRLALGTRVTAGNQTLAVEHEGRARWTLEPHATASVADAGEFLTVRLDSGALSASVVPKPKPETFAVEVGSTRVAVHGTAFRVERVGDHVLVEVTEGTVAVEPTSTHSDPSFLLRRGSRGSFGLDGRSGSVEGNASVMTRDNGPESRREIARGATPSSARARPTAAAAAERAVKAKATTTTTTSLPEQPSISDIESGVSTALELMNRCFEKTHSTDIRVSVSTGMTLSVAADGTVQSVTFGPPLAPAVEDCGVAGLRNLTFPHSLEGATFTRILELKR